MPAFDVYPATALASAEQLRHVLETSICDPLTGEILGEEVMSVLASIDLARQTQGDRYYAVAITSGNTALGVMGLQPPDERMKPFTAGHSPIEVVHAHVAGVERGSGVGSLLLHHLEAEARNRNHDELILNSGPRYEFTGWPFWRRMYGDPTAKAKDYYGPGNDAMVWSKSLVDEK